MFYSSSQQHGRNTRPAPVIPVLDHPNSASDMMRKRARKKPYRIERFQLLSFFALIFAAPLYAGFTSTGSDYSYAFALSMLALSLPLMMVHSAPAASLHIENRRAFEIILLIGLSIMALTYYGIGQGLSDRSAVRAGTTNINLNGSLLTTLLANSNFLVSGIAAYQIQKGLDTGRRSNLYIGIFLAAAMLAMTGTRFLFMLSTAPLFYSFFFDSSYMRKALLFVLVAAASSFVAIARSGFNIDVASLVFFDLPSTASMFAVQDSAPSVGDIGNFFIGNIVVLIPRWIFPAKPVDPSVVEFTISHLGAAAFDAGVTYLPGFIGSAWLYGGWFGVLIFSSLLGYLFVKSFPNDRRASYTQRTLKALLFIGLILQFRNISIFYLLPYLYTAIGLRSTAAIRSLLLKKQNLGGGN